MSTIPTDFSNYISVLTDLDKSAFVKVAAEFRKGLNNPNPDELISECLIRDLNTLHSHESPYFDMHVINKLYYPQVTMAYIEQLTLTLYEKLELTNEMPSAEDTPDHRKAFDDVLAVYMGFSVHRAVNKTVFIFPAGLIFKMSSDVKTLSVEPDEINAEYDSWLNIRHIQYKLKKAIKTQLPETDSRIFLGF